MLKKSALIFGVSGQDGSLLSDLLLKKGYAVFGQTRNLSAKTTKNLDKLAITSRIRFEECELSDINVIRDLIERIKPEEVYNLSGQSSVGLSYSLPYETFESQAFVAVRILEAIRQSGVKTRFLNASSGDCFGETSETGATEDSNFQPRNPYAAAKCSASLSVICYRDVFEQFACNAYMFNHESHLRGEAFVTRKIIKSVVSIAHGHSNDIKLGDISVKRDWGCAEEYVEGIWRILQHEVPQDFIIATGRHASLEYFLTIAFSYFDMNWRDYVKYESVLARPSEIKINCGNASKARHELGWQPQLELETLIPKLIKHELSRQIISDNPKN